jgi:hypothetical protein
MAKLKGLQLITVLTISVKDSAVNIAEHGQLQHTTGNPLLAAIPTNDAAMGTLCTTLLTNYHGYKAVPPTVTKTTVSSKKLAVVTAYNANAGYIQGVARAQAIATGDINVGIGLVQAAGYHIKKTRSATLRGFKVTNAGVGAVDITTKAVAVHAGYIRQYGPTPAKYVPPTAAAMAELLFTVDVAAHVNNLKSNTIYGFREASILPAGHKTPTPNTTPTTAVQKAATPTAATKAHKAIFTDGVASHYVWSEWIYIVAT